MMEFFVRRLMPKRRNCIFAATMLCLVIQAFLIISYNGPNTSALQDRGSIQFMQAINNITNFSSFRPEQHRLNLLDKADIISHIFLLNLYINLTDLPFKKTFYIWTVSVGFEQEAAPSADMVFLN